MARATDQIWPYLLGSGGLVGLGSLILNTTMRASSR